MDSHLSLELAGLPFTLSPADALSADELQAMQRFDPEEYEPGAPPGFALSIVKDPPWPCLEHVRSQHQGPAAVTWEQERIRISHRDFAAELDPIAATGTLCRSVTSAFPLEVSLRVALCSRLPLDGGLPLHAAGIIAEGAGLVFFGPSGAGKSTISAASPYPVLSDELVAVRLDPPRLISTGFWGELDGISPKGTQAPLRALLALHKGQSFGLQRLEPGIAVRQLLQVLMVPVAPPLWRQAMALISDLVDRVPVYRMT